MNYLLCIDDTDQLEGPGTGHLLQALCETLAGRGWCSCSPISRHQLFVHEAIPYTSHNSSLCSTLTLTHDNLQDVIDFCGRFLEEKSAPGSDPGLCMVRRDIKDRHRLIDFGNRAKGSVLTKDDAYELAGDLKIHLSEHGGTGQGVVGALAGAGLHLSGEDGRFRGWYHLGREGTSFCVKELVSYPFIDSIQSESGEILTEDTVVHLGGDELKLILKNGQQILPVTRTSSGWKTLTKKEVKKY